MLSAPANAALAIELKRKAPRAHTFLEVVKKRYGPAGHITLMCYSLIFQIFTTVNLLVGGSTLYSSMTGMNRDAACFLFPIGVLIYTLFGGTSLSHWPAPLQRVPLFVSFHRADGIAAAPEQVSRLHSSPIG